MSRHRRFGMFSLLIFILTVLVRIRYDTWWFGQFSWITTATSILNDFHSICSSLSSYAYVWIVCACYFFRFRFLSSVSLVGFWMKLFCSRRRQFCETFVRGMPKGAGILANRSMQCGMARKKAKEKMLLVIMWDSNWSDACHWGQGHSVRTRYHPFEMMPRNDSNDD